MHKFLTSRTKLREHIFAVRGSAGLQTPHQGAREMAKHRFVHSAATAHVAAMLETRSQEMAFVIPNSFVPLRTQTTPTLRRPRRSTCYAAATPSPRAKVRNTSPPYKEAAETYLQSLGLSREDSKRAVSRLPLLANEPDLSATAAPTLEYLCSELNLSDRQVARAVRNAPQIFFRSRTAFAKRLELLEQVAHIPRADLPAAIAKCPHVLWMNLKSASEVVNSIVEACPFITSESLGSLFSRVPQALVTSPAKIRGNIHNIRNAGVSDSSSMGRIFAKAPLTLVYDAKKSFTKRLGFLSEQLGFSTRTVGKILVSTPEVLEWSVEKTLKPRVSLLESLVGADSVSGIVDKVPSIFGIDDILDRVLWLRDEVGLSEYQIREVLREAPAILTYSVVGNLAPKWTFIHETMGGTREDLVAAPCEALCANLQQRAMPRYAFLASSGDVKMSVVDILRGSDADFCRDVAKCDPEVFRAYVDNDTYLLFFSRLM